MAKFIIFISIENIIMANIITQTCSHCGETKPLDREHFHKNKGRTCGYMAHCKPCQMKKVTPYNQSNTSYWKRYRVQNKQYIRDYYQEYYDTDQPIKIYGIQNPLGEVYVGMSQMRDWMIRISQHKSSYRTKPGSYPKLHESIDTHGWDTHQFILIEEMGTKDRSRGMSRESMWIEHYHKMGKSLNVHKIK